MSQSAAQSPLRRIMHPMKPRLVTVSAVESISPRYRRVTVQGDDLADFVSLDPDDHMKLAFPRPGETVPVLPEWGEKGPIWPEGAEKPALRDYTPRRVDTERRELIIDFVLHGAGPASDWAAEAKPGDRIGVLGPRGSKVVDNIFDWYLMIGDETVLPSIARRLEEMPSGARAIAMIEISGDDDEQTIDTDADARIIWVHRGDAEPGTTQLLEDAIRELEMPQGTPFVWAGGEATTLRPIRRFLLNERGVPREFASFSGHWKRGIANHDHHEPIDDDETPARQH